jgi:hypothetical protein
MQEETAGFTEHAAKLCKCRKRASREAEGGREFFARKIPGKYL